MTQRTHDHGPLKVQTCINRDETLIFSERRLIGSTIGLGHKANAERLAHAWSCHDELLGALKAVMSSYPATTMSPELREKAIAAIAKAEAK